MTCVIDGKEIIWTDIVIIGDLILCGGRITSCPGYDVIIEPAAGQVTRIRGRLIGEDNDFSSGNIWDIGSTPSAPSSACVVCIEADGTNWASGSACLKLIADSNNTQPLVITDGIQTILSVNRSGTLAIDSSFQLTGGGIIRSSAGGDVTLLPDTVGITIIGDAGVAIHISGNDSILITGSVEIIGTLYLRGSVEISADVSLTNHSSPLELADQAFYDLPDATAGWAFLMVGNSEEYAHFMWDNAGNVDMLGSSANVVTADTPGKFCVFDNGTQVRIRNRLGATKKIVLDPHFTTP